MLRNISLMSIFNPPLPPLEKGEPLLILILVSSLAGLGLLPPELLKAFRESPKPLLYETVDRAFGKFSVRAPCSDGGRDKYLHALVNGFYGINREKTFTHGLDHLFFEHEIPHVPLGHYNALLSREAPFGAHVEEALYLFVYASHGLNVSYLVHGACYGDALIYRKPGKA